MIVYFSLKEEDTHVLAGESFLPLARNYPRVTRKNCYQNFNVMTPEHFLKIFCKKVDTDLPNVLNFSRIDLMYK